MPNLFKLRRYRFNFRYIVLPLTLFCLIGCRTLPEPRPVSTPVPLSVTLEAATLTPEIPVTTPLQVKIEVATLTPQVTIMPPPRITIEVATLTLVPQHPVDNAFTYLHAVAKENALLDSYATTATFDNSDTAWTYDNALVLLAFLARGRDEDLMAAAKLADALVYAQAHDPEFDDGRLRDAYHANTFIRDDGTVHVDRSGSATGNMAWATLALIEAWQVLGDEAYLTAAQRLGQWIFNHTHNRRGAGGYTGGLDSSGTPFQWKATEHNADIYPAFMRLYEATDNVIWRERAMSAKHFLQAMWDGDQGLFWTGTTADGATINPNPIPEDTQSWTVLALGENEKYGRGLLWAEENLSGEDCTVSETAVGYRFSNAGSGYWPEGTAHMALAWQLAGETTRAENLLASLRSLQVTVPNLEGRAIPAACGTEAVTGYGWAYPLDVPHIGATAWYLMAELAFNPFWGIATAEQVPFAGIYDHSGAAFQNGMSYTAWRQGDYQQPAAADSLQALADTQRNWIAIIVTCYQESHADTTITCDLPRTPTDEDLRAAIGQAHELGLQVMLKPHLDLNNDPDHWRGDIGDQFTSNAEWSAWFAAYKDFIIHYAALAESEGVAQLAVGTELAGTSGRDAEWRAVVTDVREHFSGSLVYASNHGGEESSITWWDALDYIGVDAYYSLADNNDPTQDELRDAWAQPLATLTDLAARYGKTIIATEIGYRSLEGSTQAPWVWTAAGEVDLQEQADAYQVALDMLCPQPWLAGIYWWAWSPQPEGGELDIGYTPRGKPAEAILRTNTCFPPDLSDLPDDTFLDLIEHRAFLYFWQGANPETGLVKDRAHNFGEDDYSVASTAATGFGLTAICIGQEREWITEEEAYERALTTLRFYRDEMENVHGFYFHFVDVNTGQRVWESEVSSIDTALFLAGALTAGQCFPDTEVEVIANELYERADFQWLLTDDGTRPEELLLSHGWKPETGFLPYRWDTYSELMILYLLAIGSPTYPIPAESWTAWARPEGTYAGHTTFAQGPLFTHQYSHAWIDFRNIQDNLGYDYFNSSVYATLANQQFAIDNRAHYLAYDEHVWGFTASDGPDGRYHAYGAPPGTAVHDGTIAPSAAAGSIVFTPELSTLALRTMAERYGTQLWGRYGFGNAFNMDQAWWDTDTIGIDAGITLLMIENHRNGFVWQMFMAHTAVQKAMQAVGFVP